MSSLAGAVITWETVSHSGRGHPIWLNKLLVTRLQSQSSAGDVTKDAGDGMADRALWVWLHSLLTFAYFGEPLPIRCSTKFTAAGS